MNQMMLLAETEMRTTLNYGRKNYVYGHKNEMYNC